jgi:hypothetical protein
MTKTMMQVGRALVLVVSLAMGMSATAAMQNEPTDFRGIPWGATLSEYQRDLILLTGDEQLAHYRRASDPPSFANVEVRRISYRFYKSRFSGGAVLLVGASNLKSMLAYLTQYYGPPESVNDRHRVYTWSGNRVGVTVSCDITISCYVEYYDKDLREVELAEQGGAPAGVKRDD